MSFISENSDSIIFKKHKVLIATITSDAKLYCQDDFLENLLKIDYKPAQIVIIDNSENDKNYKNLIKRGFNAYYLPRKGRTAKEMMYKSESFLNGLFLKGKFSFLLRLESDLFPPQDIIQRLMIHKLPIVGAAYFIGLGASSHLMMQQIEQKGGVVKELQTCNVDKMHDMIKMTGGLVEVYSCGHGCMLTHRSVEEKIKLTYDSKLHPDSQWHYFASQFGYKKYIDTSILIEHRNRLWIGDENL